MTRAQAPSTANIADACLRLGIPYSTVSMLKPASPSCEFAGRAMPVRHFGSVDVFLEAIENSQPGEVLIVDNDGREDEGCIGDLIALETAMAGFAGIIIWGRHRDSADLASIAIPVFSLGSCPSGPRRLNPQSDDRFESARIGAVAVTRNDEVVGDADGLLILPHAALDEVSREALRIRSVEGTQAERMRSGESLRKQLGWADYVRARSADSGLTFRQHLSRRGGAVET